MPVKTDIAVALEQLKAQANDYLVAQEYYDGEHALKFATRRYREVFGGLFNEFADNLCPLVVDALADRLEVVGFSLEGEGPPEEQADEPDQATKELTRRVSRLAWKVWVDNRMNQQAGQVHQECLLKGDSYVIVWPSRRDRTRPRIYPQLANEMTVKYDPEEPGEMLWAAKCWRSDEGYLRLNMYYPEEIRRYRTKSSQHGDVVDVGMYPNSADAFEPYAGDDFEAVVPHSLGRVPVFHFANNAAVGRFGASELRDVIPLQDALNKSVLDMMVGMEFAALPQRWATGIEPPNSADDESRPRSDTDPFVPGVDRLWAIEDKDGKFGQFPSTDLTQYLDVQEGFRLEIARVSGTPLHYLMLVRGQVSSGEAVKALDDRFTKKGEDRQKAFGNTWEDAVAFALQIMGEPTDLRLSARWKAIRSRSEKEHVDTQFVKHELGVPRKQLLLEMDYTEEQVETFQAEWEREKQQERDWMVQGTPNRARQEPPRGGPKEPPVTRREGAGTTIRDRR